MRFACLITKTRIQTTTHHIIVNNITKYFVAGQQWRGNTHFRIRGNAEHIYIVGSYSYKNNNEKGRHCRSYTATMDRQMRHNVTTHAYCLLYILINVTSKWFTWTRALHAPSSRHFYRRPDTLCPIPGGKTVPNVAYLYTTHRNQGPVTQQPKSRHKQIPFTALPARHFINHQNLTFDFRYKWKYQIWELPSSVLLRSE
jgi:hypothetical protein